MRRYLLFLFAVLVITLIVPAIGNACPSCKTIDDPIVQGFKWSILFLMAMPYLVSGLIGGSVFCIYKHTNRTNNHKPSSNVKGV